jgi:hypothetical protein
MRRQTQMTANFLMPNGTDKPFELGLTVCKPVAESQLFAHPTQVTVTCRRPAVTLSWESSWSEWSGPWDSLMQDLPVEDDFVGLVMDLVRPQSASRCPDELIYVVDSGGAAFLQSQHVLF